MTSMLDMLRNYVSDRAADLPRIAAARAALDSLVNLTLNQAYLLAAVAHDYKPDVILDIGTGEGNSAAVFSIACPTASIYTFDRYQQWRDYVTPRLRPLGIAADVRSFVGDLTAIDFAPIIGDARSVVVFWDAHGFAVAQHILGHIMPLIAERKHIVLVHDMSHIRNYGLDYDGRSIWSGMDAFDRSPETTAHLIVGWTVTSVDQVLPITDFCTRNQLVWRSVDDNVQIDDAERAAELSRIVGMSPAPTFDMGYFSMNDTTLRRFPPSGFPAAPKRA